MTCTLLIISILSTSPTAIDDLLQARSNEQIWAIRDAENISLSEPYEERVELIASDGRIALIEFNNGARMFTRAEHDLKDCE